MKPLPDIAEVQALEDAYARAEEFDRAQQAEADKAVCPACAAGAPRSYVGMHHPGFAGKRYYRCRAAWQRRYAEDEEAQLRKAALSRGAP